MLEHLNRLEYLNTVHWTLGSFAWFVDVRFDFGPPSNQVSLRSKLRSLRIALLSVTRFDNR